MFSAAPVVKPFTAFQGEVDFVTLTNAPPLGLIPLLNFIRLAFHAFVASTLERSGLSAKCL